LPAAAANLSLMCWRMRVAWAVEATGLPGNPNAVQIVMRAAGVNCFNAASVQLPESIHSIAAHCSRHTGAPVPATSCAGESRACARNIPRSAGRSAPRSACPAGSLEVKYGGETMFELCYTPNVVSCPLGFELPDCLANYARCDLRDARTILAITTRTETVMNKRSTVAKNPGRSIKKIFSSETKTKSKFPCGCDQPRNRRHVRSFSPNNSQCIRSWLILKAAASPCCHSEKIFMRKEQHRQLKFYTKLEK
jgi:hypothetical protein